MVKPTKAAVSSTKESTEDVIGAFLSWIITPFSTEKTDAVKAAKTPNNMPNAYFISTEKIKQIAPIIINPIRSS